MSEAGLTQSEADLLLAVEKTRVSEEIYPFPQAGKSLSLPVKSIDLREDFWFDLIRGSIRMTKCSYQNRARSVIVLARLDVDGPGHRNPDMTEVECPHIHLFREGFGDKWAFPAEEVLGPLTSDLFVAWLAFARFCNVVELPNLERGLF